MAWVKLDDRFLSNRKIQRVEPLDRLLWIGAICWSSGEGLDGFIPSHMLSFIAAMCGVPQPDLAANRLVDAGLWELTLEGWTTHDFLAYQPSKAEREKAASQHRERQRRYAERQNKAPDGNPDASADGPVTLLPSRPVPIHTSDAISLRLPQGGAGGDDDDDRPPEAAVEAVNLLAGRLLARRQAEVADPVRHRRGWLTRAAGELWDEHRAQLADLAAAGRTAGEIADRLDPAQQATPVAELAPACARCGGLRHYPDQPHRVAETDLLPEEAS